LKNPVAFELKRYLKNLENDFQYHIFFLLDVKTNLQSLSTNFESIEYQSEDAFDRFLKIRFFPTIMDRINPIFMKSSALYIKKLRNAESVTVSFLNEFKTFFTYSLCLSPILKRLMLNPDEHLKVRSLYLIVR